MMKSRLLNTCKVGLIGAGALAAAIVFSGPMGRTSPQQAEAGPTQVLALNSVICTTLGSAFGGLEVTFALSSCSNLAVQDGATSMQGVVRCLRGSDSDHDGVKEPQECLESLPEPYEVLPSDFAVMDLDKDQVSPGLQLRVLGFVNNDAPVRFTTTGGEFPGGDDDFFCETAAQDPDCDGDGSTAGDGVVVANIDISSDVDPGTYTVTVIQEGVGFPFDFTVVGSPEDITFSPVLGKDHFQTGATECEFAGSVAGVLDTLNQAEKTVYFAKAIDEDGNEVIGVLLDWNHPDSLATGPRITFETTLPNQFPSDQGGVALPQTPTLDLGSFGAGFPQFFCGGEEPGTFAAEVRFDQVLGGNYDTTDTFPIEIKVLGPPDSMTLTAEPANLVCDGVNSSKVTATVVTENGDPVANGVDVTFDVQVLGTANPITANSGAGSASTTVTPLSGTNRGVPVIVTAGDLQQSILINCTAGAPGTTPPPPAGGAQPGARPPSGVTGPDTGSGPLGAEGAGRLSWWPAIALAAAGAALAGARLTVRRR